MFWNNSRTFYNRSAWHFRLFPSSRSRQALLLYCHVHSFLILHYLYYISQRSNTKKCFWITGLQREDSKPSADNNRRYSPAKSITECINFIKRAGLWTDFWQLDDIFEPPGRNDLIVWKTDSRFFLSRLTRPMGVWGSHGSRAYATRYWFLYWFWGKNRLFCSLPMHARELY